MKTRITISFILILAIQYLTIELLGDTIATESIRVACMAIACLIFTVTWIYLTVRVLKARQPRAYYDRDFSAVIETAKKQPMIYRESETTHITRA